MKINVVWISQIIINLWTIHNLIKKHEMGSPFGHILSKRYVLSNPNGTIASKNENNQLKEAKQGVTDDSMASSLDYVEAEITKKSSKSLDLKCDFMAASYSKRLIHVSHNVLKQPLNSTQQKLNLCGHFS